MRNGYRGILAAGMLWSAAATLTQADTLVITTNGLYFWAAAVQAEGENLRCQMPPPDKDRLLPGSTVAFVLPSISKGKVHTPADAEKALKEIDAAGRRYPKLLRQLNTLRQDWSTVLRPDTGTESRIDELLAKFDASDKSPAAFKEISLQLDMLRFRDKQGLHAGKMDSAREHMLDGFMKWQQPRFDKMASARPYAVSNLAIAARHAESMKLCPVSAQTRKSLDEAVARYRDETFTALCGGAAEALSSRRTMDAYLAANDLLAELDREFGNDPACRGALSTWRKRVDEAAVKALPDYDFSFRGYPLMAEDTNLLHAGGCATSGVHGIRLDEQCCLLVNIQKEPSAAAGLELALRLVFRRTQPADRQFGLAGRLRSGSTQSSTTVWKLPAVTVTHGRVDVPFRSAFPRWSSASGGAPASYDFIFHIVHAAPDSTPSEPKWIGASQAFVMRLKP